MTDDRFDLDETLNDAHLAQTVDEALRGLRIASSGRSEAKLRSAVAELGRRSPPLLVAPKLAVDPHWVSRDVPVGDAAVSSPSTSKAVAGTSR